MSRRDFVCLSGAMDFDIVIVGGGPAGLGLARSLAGSETERALRRAVRAGTGRA